LRPVVVTVPPPKTFKRGKGKQKKHAVSCLCRYDKIKYCTTIIAIRFVFNTCFFVELYKNELQKNCVFLPCLVFTRVWTEGRGAFHYDI
jgi:hypothetical protein